MFGNGNTTYQKGEQKRGNSRMAEKRMLSKKVLDADAFLDMPLSAQALYFHLVMNADDEGFIGNPKRIRDYIGAAESDLDLLIENRFVLILKNSVAVIRHWKIHNTLRRDRSHPTVFTEEKSQLILQENGAYAEKVTSGCAYGNQMSTACQPNDNQRLTSCQLNDNQMSTEDKIEEDRLREDKIEEVVTPAISERRTIRFHKPTIDEIVAYCSEKDFKLDVHRFYDYYESNGWRVGKTPMKDWQAAIRNWVRNEQNKYPLLPPKPVIDADKYKREDE